MNLVACAADSAVRAPEKRSTNMKQYLLPGWPVEIALAAGYCTGACACYGRNRPAPVVYICLCDRSVLTEAVDQLREAAGQQCTGSRRLEFAAANHKRPFTARLMAPPSSSFVMRMQVARSISIKIPMMGRIERVSVCGVSRNIGPADRRYPNSLPQLVDDDIHRRNRRSVGVSIKYGACAFDELALADTVEVIGQ